MALYGTLWHFFGGSSVPISFGKNDFGRIALISGAIFWHSPVFMGREPLDDRSRLGDVRQHDPFDRRCRDDRGIDHIRENRAKWITGRKNGSLDPPG
jgi:hypothetical protein